MSPCSLVRLFLSGRSHSPIARRVSQNESAYIHHPQFPLGNSYEAPRRARQACTIVFLLCNVFAMRSEADNRCMFQTKKKVMQRTARTHFPISFRRTEPAVCFQGRAQLLSCTADVPNGDSSKSWTVLCTVPPGFQKLSGGDLLHDLKKTPRSTNLS